MRWVKLRGGECWWYTHNPTHACVLIGGKVGAAESLKPKFDSRLKQEGMERSGAAGKGCHLTIERRERERDSKGTIREGRGGGYQTQRIRQLGRAALAGS